ncbi:MAG TPA: hypothetical protein DCQ30_00960 [Acidimicrobiaceae bacterium]|nr:hypothetical protein [Acidimicrobiaceae bacterium]
MACTDVLGAQGCELCDQQALFPDLESLDWGHVVRTALFAGTQRRCRTHRRSGVRITIRPV